MANARYGNRVLVGLALLLVAQAAFLMLRRPDQAPAVPPRYLVEGDALADVPVVAPDGSPGTLRAATADAPATVLLVFHSECAQCEKVAPDWRAWLAEPREGVRTYAVTREPHEAGAAYAEQHAWDVQVLEVPEPEPGSPAFSLLMRTPWLVVIDADGVVAFQDHGSELTGADRAIAALLDTAPAAP